MRPTFPAASSVVHCGSNLSAFGATSQSIAPPFLRPQMLDLSNLRPVQAQVLQGSLFGAQTTHPGVVFQDFAGVAGLQQTGPTLQIQNGVSNPIFPCINETNSNYNPFL